MKFNLRKSHESHESHQHQRFAPPLLRCVETRVSVPNVTPIAPSVGPPNARDSSQHHAMQHVWNYV